MIELSHVGEILIAKILNESSAALNSLCLKGPKIGQNVLALPELRLNNCGPLMFDGAHRIDIAVLDHDNKICHPIEAKLGLDRLAKISFNRCFLNECGTSHDDTRVKGSMIAILERKLPPQCRHQLLYVTHDDVTYEISDNWTLVCRTQVAANWAKNGHPNISSKCTIITFENLEPPRLYRRLHTLRRWSYEYIKKIFPGSTGTRSAHGAGATEGTQFTVGRHPVDSIQAWLHE